MRIADNTLKVSPTDLANFLACDQKTRLDLAAAHGRIAKPTWQDPLAVVLQERGEAHERQYVARLVAEGRDVVDLSHAREDRLPHDEAVALTVAAMKRGAEVIVQPALGDATWFGYADVLLRIPVASALGDWSYEVQDTKLSRETRGGTILQLCVYTEIVRAIQGLIPEHFRVVTPIDIESFRFGEFAAFYRSAKARLIEFVANEESFQSRHPSAADPVGHCAVCRWWERCDADRRAVDHVGFVAGMGRSQQRELAKRNITTLAAVAAMTVPLVPKPQRGAPETYAKLQDQAALQLERRCFGTLPLKLLPMAIDPEIPAGADPSTKRERRNIGLRRLPDPSPGDLFLDLEGDPFARPSTTSDEAGGREYLFGVGRIDPDGAWIYTARWALDDAGERAAFEAVMDDAIATIAAHPAAHIYHYAAYEPVAFKRLMGRYASRRTELDFLLRGERFVDLFAVVRHALRAGVESYSIKEIEPYYHFKRDVDLKAAGADRRIVERALESGDPDGVAPAVRKSVEGYNDDDCRSTLRLREWLESLRAEVIASGTEVPRAAQPEAEASERVTERDKRSAALVQQLLAGVDPNSAHRSEEGNAKVLLADLLDFHQREFNAGWWEYFRLRDLAEEDLYEERKAVAGLQFVERVDVIRNKKNGKPTGSVIDRYEFPDQNMDLEEGDGLKLKDERAFGSVDSVDRVAKTIAIRKGPAMAEEHPASAFHFLAIAPGAIQEALFALADDVVAKGIGEAQGLDCRRALLLKRAPRLTQGAFVRADESPVQFAVRSASSLNHSVLAIQGPPGSGKTFTGAELIVDLVHNQGKRVGVTANSHKVIRNLLKAVHAAASKNHIRLPLMQKWDDGEGDDPAIEEFKDNAKALAALAARPSVLGGTAWLWASDKSRGAVDILVVDEAGQMSLASVLAAASSAGAGGVILLGDPQQLDQPQKGSHPDGVDISALQHILGEKKVMPSDRGIFLPETWRLAPAICDFTSEVFYENGLHPKAGLERQRLIGADGLEGSGLRIVEVAHDGNKNASLEEVEAVAGIVSRLLAPGSMWIDEDNRSRQLVSEDLCIVAPYNAQVSRLRDRLGESFRVGTVDKFQGQQAPVVIYSMATSRPEDAPRGLAFLYSLNRLNVATSRAKCLCILVASPRLFEPDCQTPRQMQLANALCGYREMAGDLSGAEGQN